MCDEWKQFSAFFEWATKTKDARFLRRHDESADYSPANCYWSNVTEKGDRFCAALAKLRMDVIGETLQEARDWLSSVSKQRQRQWWNMNCGDPELRAQERKRSAIANRNYARRRSGTPLDAPTRKYTRKAPA